MASIVYGLLLSAKGDVKKIKLLDSKVSKTLTEESLQDILKKKTKVSELGTYPASSFVLTLFGYTTGKAGTENKHELPPPLDTTLYFGDILVIASPKSSSWKLPISFTVEQYEKWYQNAFGGFDDLDEDEDEDEDEDADVEAEVEDDVEDVPKSTKKKAAEEDGIPEDEADAEEEEEEDDDELEEDEEDGEVIAEDEEAEVVPKQVKASKKKKVSKTAYSAQNTALSRQYSLQSKASFKEIETPIALEKSEGKEKQVRQHVLTCIQSQFGRLFKKSDQQRLEFVILKSAIQDATSKTVLKHFDNPLFELCYMSAARRILGNLNTKSYVGNQHLLQKVLQGALPIDTLADMTVMDYAPTIYAPLRERMILREQHQLEGNKAMATDLFKCGRCHKRECTYYELQTRSADEPMTKFISCLNCGNHWRM